MSTPTTTKTEPFVGRRIRRQEDPRLITGTATYVDDIKKPGMLYFAVLRSPYPAAKIKSIDASKALELPGVRAVYTGKDVASVGPVPCAGSMPTLRVPHHTILATDRVYYVGHPVAAAVATDRYVAQDALARIEVDYEPIDEFASDPEEALNKDAPRVHPEYPDNIAFTYHQEGGDVSQSLRRSRCDGQPTLRRAAPGALADGNPRRGRRIRRRRQRADRSTPRRRFRTCSRRNWRCSSTCPSITSA